MLCKQQQVVHHRPQLQEIVDPPTDHETPEDRSPQHKEPLLDPERYQTDYDRAHRSPDDRNVDMLAEKLDIDRGEDKPSDEKTDASSGEEYPDVVDADGEYSAYGPRHHRDCDCGVRDPGLMEVLGGEGEDREIGEGATNDKANEEEDNFDEPVTCVM